jgi:hypothetical protein
MVPVATTIGARLLLSVFLFFLAGNVPRRGASAVCIGAWEDRAAMRLCEILEELFEV